MPGRVIPESEWAPVSEWRVHRFIYPCCGSKPRIGKGQPKVNALYAEGKSLTKECPKCFVTWVITFEMSIWAEQPPFIKCKFKRES